MHGGALEPVLARADLAGPRVSVLNLGGLANPDVLLVERAGEPRWVVKDWGRRSAWVRALVAPLLVRHELAMLARVAGLPGVPQRRQRIDRLALALEFVEGRPLRRRTHGRALPAAFFGAIERILDGLAARGVVYLDLRSPTNVLVTPSGAPVLVDLGSALALPLPRALRGALERRALAKLRARFEGERAVRADTAGADPGRDLKVAGTRFRVRERGSLGDARPLVLLPDAGFSARLLEPIAADAAARGRRVLAVDLPGFGGSRREVASLEPGRIAAQLLALLDALRLREVELCAAGWAAFPAAALGARAPGRVARWVAVDAADAPERRAAFAAQSDPERLRELLAARLPAELGDPLRGELLAELARAPAATLARAFLAARIGPTPNGVEAARRRDLSWAEALAPGRVLAELARG